MYAMRIFGLVLLLLTSQFVFAQTQKCLSPQAVDRLEEKFPGYKEAVEKTFTDAMNRAQLKDANETNEILTIPVVFGLIVVWTILFQEMR